jgi:hypothetical protein
MTYYIIKSIEPRLDQIKEMRETQQIGLWDARKLIRHANRKAAIEALQEHLVGAHTTDVAKVVHDMLQLMKDDKS